MQMTVKNILGRLPKRGMKHSLAFLFVLSAVGVHAASTWYVDAIGGNDANDGKTIATAVKTLKAAMEIPLLADGDTVIALPGIYESEMNQGADGAKARVVIDKAITLKSLNGRSTRDVTIIKGTKGDDPVRCITIALSDANKSAKVEGFTILDGGTSTDGEDAPNNRGGGVMVLSGSGYAVDCSIRDCAARTGGGMAGAVASAANAFAVRCHIHSCSATTQGMGLNTVAAYYCVFSDFPKTSINVIYHTPPKPRPCINCTFYCNAASSTVAGPMLNTLIIQSTALNDNIHGTNCVATTTLGKNFVSSTKSANGSPTFMMAPAIGDYRAIAGQDGIGCGDAAFIEQIPQEFRFTDFNGDTVVAEGGKVTVGACTVPVEPVGGYLVFNETDYRVNGKGISFAWTRIHSDRADARVKISALSESAGVWSADSGSGKVYPSCDGSVTIPLPAVKMNISDVVQTARVVRVGLNRSFTTIQSAIDAVGEEKTIVMVDPGTYSTGGAKGCGLKNRVFIGSGKSIQLISTDGPGFTVVEGKAASESVVGDLAKAEYGLGSDAERCLAVESNEFVRISGFTFSNGHVNYDGASSPENTPGGCGGGIYCSNGDVLVENCTVTNCFGVRGGGVYNGTYVNCRIVDNVAVYVASAANQAAGSGSNNKKLKLHNCLLDGNGGCGSVVYYSTIIDSCTFGSRNYGKEKNNVPSAIGGASDKVEVRNSLFLKGFSTSGIAMTLTNCAYFTNCKWKDGSVFFNCVTADSFDVTADGVPVGSPENALMGAADASLWNAALYGDRDLAGRARFRGDEMDVGCYQADMTAVYKVKLNPQNRIEIDSEGADVVVDANGIRVVSGTMALATGNRAMAVPVSVTGSGVCIVRNVAGNVCCGAITQSMGASVTLEKNAEYVVEYYAGVNELSGAGTILGEGAVIPTSLRMVIR